MKKKIIFNEQKFMYRELDGDYVVMNLKSGVYYTLSKTGRLLFKAILDGADREKMAQVLVDHYRGVKAERIQKDVDDFLVDLKKEGVILLE